MRPLAKSGCHRGWRHIFSGATGAIALAVSLAGAGTASAATAVQVSAGGSHTCALLSGGSVDCWGDNQWGELGDGLTTDSSMPVPVFGLEHAVQVSAGGFHTCALLGDGTVDCWGDNTSGQLGNGTTTSISTPVAVSGLANVTAIGAGWEHTCALLADGTVECWGNGASGQLGNGGTESLPNPTPVSGLGEVSAIGVGFEHTCATRENGEVACWGDDSGGQLGDGFTTASPTPVTVPGVAGAVRVGAGNLYTCALLSGGEVECWGQLNPEGETTNQNPTPVVLGGEATAISVGGFHACASLGGAVECWGDDYAGQLGSGEAAEGLLAPVSVPGLGAAEMVSAGLAHTCAVVAAGGVECWGANESGQLGSGGPAGSPTPLRVAFPDELPAAPGGEAGAQAPGGSERQPATAAKGAAPIPVFGKTVTLVAVSGSVLVKLPGRRGFAPLAAASSVPLGTVVDASRGTVRLSAATGAPSETQSGLFGGGVFRTAQRISTSPFRPGRVGLTVLTLVGSAPSCAGGGARASGRRHGGNHLWGEDDHGNFQTGGRFASATVGGTRWLTAETCAGTRIAVARGVVSVTDRVRHRTVLVTAHHSYLARPARR